jgi:acetolactate synthase-1/2/3 large subunit
MNVSEVITGYLNAAGIARVYGYPGDPNIEFMEALRAGGIEFVLARREGTAALMAQAYGMVTGRPGVCMSTLGPGASNMVNGVANAYLDRVPMLAISGQIDNLREPLFTHQVIDHNRIFSPVSKWVASVLPGNVGGIMRRALAVASAERPGPVHLTTPANVVGAEAGDADIILPPLPGTDGGVALLAAPGVNTDVAARLKESRRPLIIAGISAARAKASASLVRMAETTGAPVIVSPMAKGVFPEDHALFAGTLDMACSEFLWDFVCGADLVLNVGFDAVELIKPWQVTAPTIHIDSVANTDQIYFAEIELVGPIGAAIDALTDDFKSEPKWAEAELAAHQAELRKRMTEGRVTGKLNPTDVVDVMRAEAADNTVVTTDVGSHKLLIGQGWTTRNPGGVLMSNGLSSMGFSLPAGIAAKQLLGAAPVISFTGDGGLAMVQSELRLASALRLGLTVIVFCDGSLNRIELKQMSRQYESVGTRIEETDIVQLAGSMDCDGIYVDSEQALADAYRAQAPGRPLVIGAAIDPSQYLAQF